jgi:AcrR family transcriptional regulator
MGSRPAPSKWTKRTSLSRNSVSKPAPAGISPEARKAVAKLVRVSPTQKLDARVRRTRDALGDALIALMQQQPFDSIAVQQVLDRAGIGRSTFYNHFRDKNDLFLSDVDDFFSQMSTALQRQGDKSNRLLPAKEFFAHVAEVQPFLRALTAAQKFHDVFELGRGHFARGIEARLASMPVTRTMHPVGRAARAHALAGAFTSLLEWWLAHQRAATPEKMDALFHELAWNGLPHHAPQGSRIKFFADPSI